MLWGADLANTGPHGWYTPGGSAYHAPFLIEPIEVEVWTLGDFTFKGVDGPCAVAQVLSPPPPPPLSPSPHIWAYTHRPSAFHCHCMSPQCLLGLLVC